MLNKILFCVALCFPGFALAQNPAIGSELGQKAVGTDARQFLERILPEIGLNEDEANDFIVFWYPRLQKNELSFVHFWTDRCDELAKLKVVPTPDSVLRVLMFIEPITQERKVTPQTFMPFKRTGFALVEWGGAEISGDKVLGLE